MDYRAEISVVLLESFEQSHERGVDDGPTADLSFLGSGLSFLEALHDLLLALLNVDLQLSLFFAFVGRLFEGFQHLLINFALTLIWLFLLIMLSLNYLVRLVVSQNVLGHNFIIEPDVVIVVLGLVIAISAII